MHIPARPLSSETRAREILLSGRSRLLPRLRIEAAHSPWKTLRPGEWTTRIEGRPARVTLAVAGVLVEYCGALGLIEPAPAAWARPIPALSA